jgi:hypothetical protein
MASFVVVENLSGDKLLSDHPDKQHIISLEKQGKSDKN